MKYKYALGDRVTLKKCGSTGIIAAIGSTWTKNTSAYGVLFGGGRYKYCLQSELIPCK